MSTFKVGDRVLSTRGMEEGNTGVIVTINPDELGMVRVRFPKRRSLIAKNPENLKPALPTYLLMDKGL